MPSIVTRPVIASMASAIRLNWRIVVMVISGWRHIKSGRIATMAFVVPPLCAWSPQRYYKSRFRSTSILAKVLILYTVQSAKECICWKRERWHQGHVQRLSQTLDRHARGAGLPAAAGAMRLPAAGADHAALAGPRAIPRRVGAA